MVHIHRRKKLVAVMVLQERIEAVVVVPVAQQYSMAQQVLMVLEECLEFIMVLTIVKYKH